MIDFELNLFTKGIKYIAGVDEVGRGPIAGPLVVSAVVLNLEKVLGLLRNNEVDDAETWLYSQIKDSKKINQRNRSILDDFIKNEALNYSVIEISHKKIDSIGMGEATRVGFFESIQKLTLKPNHVFTDHFAIPKLTREDQTNINDGDNKSISVAAASIIAKVYRDGLMIEWSRKYPVYGFEKHKGYGTKEHITALLKHGPCEIHRKSFEPIKSWFK